jgi:hypothetical protein
MIGILRRHGIRFPLDISRNVLMESVSMASHHGLQFCVCVGVYTFRAMNTDRGPANVKIPVGFTDVTIAST